MVVLHTAQLSYAIKIKIQVMLKTVNLNGDNYVFVK